MEVVGLQAQLEDGHELLVLLGPVLDLLLVDLLLEELDLLFARRLSQIGLIDKLFQLQPQGILPLLLLNF